MKIIERLCPNCEVKRMAEAIEENRIVKVREENITVTVKLLRCTVCKEEFEDRSNPIDELDIAYREYRDKHNMLQPEQIKAIRKFLNMDHEKFSKLLGNDAELMMLYENGMLQSNYDDENMKRYFLFLSMLKFFKIDHREYSPKVKSSSMIFNNINKIFSFLSNAINKIYEKISYGEILYGR